MAEISEPQRSAPGWRSSEPARTADLPAIRLDAASRTGSGRSACSSCCSPACRSSTRIRRSISATSPASGFDNDVLKIGAENTEAGPRGYTKLFGAKFDTSGVLGMSGPAEQPRYVAFPGWATIPSHHDLATGRVIHFFFAWLLVATLLAWLVASVINGHFRELVPTLRRPQAAAARHRRPCAAEVPPHARLQHAAEAHLCDRAVRLLPADDPDRPRHVARRQRAAAVPAGPARRPPDRAHHPFPRDGAARRLLRHPHRDDPRGRPDQRAALDHHRLVPHRPAGRRSRAAGTPQPTPKRSA